MTTDLRQLKMDTPVGDLYLVATDKGLSGVFWKRRDIETVSTLNGSGKIVAHLRQAQKELSEYFCGKRKDFSVPLDVVGTPFQKQVWNQLKKIPFGKTISYQDLARQIKNEKACRAVGSANGKNPVSIIVPCHRVITSQGTIGGYAGGLPAKEKLLQLEFGKNIFRK